MITEKRYKGRKIKRKEERKGKKQRENRKLGKKSEKDKIPDEVSHDHLLNRKRESVREEKEMGDEESEKKIRE